ncbi:MAG: hypothetical protein J7K29_03025 [Candidatus Cloacimonetes bacterium]|nr:hypothetical protein [Candidatus Cloacimonadota bacterium]
MNKTLNTKDEESMYNAFVKIGQIEIEIHRHKKRIEELEKRKSDLIKIYK